MAAHGLRVVVLDDRPAHAPGHAWSASLMTVPKLTTLPPVVLLRPVATNGVLVNPVRIANLADESGPVRDAHLNWEALFQALGQRLKETERDLPDALPRSLFSRERFGEPAAQRPHEEAPGALRATLLADRARCLALEALLAAAHSDLARARAALAGTRLDEARARHLATHDDLTTLPNRGCFLDRLHHAIADAAARPHALALLYMDLDGFKRVNDRLGHLAGDEVLRIVAARIARGVRSVDLVGRLGGDEFVCAVTAFPHGRVHLIRLACKLHSLIAAPMRIRGASIVVPPSIGITIFPRDGDTGEALMHRADAAMYRAKRRNIGFAFFDKGQDRSLPPPD